MQSLTIFVVKVATDNITESDNNKNKILSKEKSNQ